MKTVRHPRIRQTKLQKWAPLTYTSTNTYHAGILTSILRINEPIPVMFIHYLNVFPYWLQNYNSHEIQLFWNLLPLLVKSGPVVSILFAYASSMSSVLNCNIHSSFMVDTVVISLSKENPEWNVFIVSNLYILL